MSNAQVTHETRITHTLHLTLPDDVIDQIREGNEVEIQLHSRAMNRLPAPIRLSYTTLMRLTQDR